MRSLVHATASRSLPRRNENVEFLMQRGSVMITLEVWNIRGAGPAGYFPTWLQVLVADDTDGKTEWQGISGQLRTYTRNIEATLVKTAGKTNETFLRRVVSLEEKVNDANKPLMKKAEKVEELAAVNNQKISDRLERLETKQSADMSKLMAKLDIMAKQSADTAKILQLLEALQRKHAGSINTEC